MELVSVDTGRGAETVVVGVQVHLALGVPSRRVSRRQERGLVADEVVGHSAVVRRVHGVERHQEVVDHDRNAVGREKYHHHDLQKFILLGLMYNRKSYSVHM